MNRFRSLAFLPTLSFGKNNQTKHHIFNLTVRPASQQPARFSRLAVCLGLASMLALSGCTALQVKLGAKVYLDKITVTSIAASLPKGPGIGPGEKSPLVVAVTQPDGKVLQTEGQGHGKILWKDLTVTASVVTANNKGIVSLPEDPRISEGKDPHVTITVPSHPELRAELDIPLRYDRKYVANFSGSDGRDGSSGMSGRDGASGSNGSFDPDHPSPGEDGGNGTDGSAGGDGGPGGDGPPVRVLVALRAANVHSLLQVGVFAQGQEKYFLVDPQGGSLLVRSDGGAGGSGGKGGSGGRGGFGGSGSPPGHSGRDGSNGSDGNSGRSGKGGSITVIYDPRTKPLLSTIHLSNQGGPPPVFREEPVAPLW